MPKKSVKSAHKARAARRQHRRQQPWHVRLSLHPVSLMVALCAGVFLAASTINTFGDTYLVTATVPAVLPSSPAVINSPTDGQHFNSQAVTVSGSCPNDAAYVTLAQNGTSVGTSSCTTNYFEVSTLLSPNANQLLATDYNVTDQAGPSGTPITVYYDVPVPPAPPSPPASGSTPVVDTPSPAAASVVTPVTLQVLQLDNNVAYNPVASTTSLTTQQPVFTGIAPPYSDITVLLHSDPVYCRTQANDVGFWRCVVTTSLPVGTHTVTITAVTPTGAKLSLPVFHIQTIKEVPAADQSGANQSGAFHISSIYHYQVYNVGQSVPITLVIGGGTSPYALTINWGDGHVQTLLRASTTNSVISHTYGWINKSSASYNIKIQGTDAAGLVSATQLTAQLRNPAYHNAISGAAHTSGTLNLLSDMHSWLWFLWPGYAVVILMLVGFWLGERKQLEADRRKKLKPAGRHTTRRRHA